MTCKPRKGLKPCLTFYPNYDWELAFHIYIYRERESSLCYISISSCVISYCVISRLHWAIRVRSIAYLISVKLPVEGCSLTIESSYFNTFYWSENALFFLLIMKCFSLLVHGNFTRWSEWTECTKECENGTQIRARGCSNPTPQFGGEDCEGDLCQLGLCNTHYCPSKFNDISQY